MTEQQWRTSSRCAADSPQCVEVAVPRGVATTLVRDSKNPNGGILRFPVGSLAGLANLRES